MARDQSLFFMKKGVVADRYCMCLDKFNEALELVKHRLPFYRDKQRLFSPAQVKALDNLWVHYTGLDSDGGTN
jgi:hypothetical protein